MELEEAFLISGFVLSLKSMPRAEAGNDVWRNHEYLEVRGIGVHRAGLLRGVATGSLPLIRSIDKAKASFGRHVSVGIESHRIERPRH